MLVEIKAKFSCDDCGTEFLVDLEPAYEPLAGISVFAIAEDAIRGGSYEDAVDVVQGPWRSGSVVQGPWRSGSVGDDGRHYCAECTLKHDARARKRKEPRDAK